MDLKKIEQQMANLEMQLTFQEDTIESLNKLVTEQTQQMTEMQRQIRWLGKRLKQMQEQNSDNSDPAKEPPPPHY
ncbi:SlyX family protein [Idiomarina sp. UBA4520]|jgi:SlyX protein|uniref:SlyX family protein n=1 Tax=Idiomarina sp. UBA4520 TaxID=1946647 RepID=UPI000A82421B|nr:MULTISPECIES: SlyX family protein [unclassified Idiomarina]MBF38177.1 SlyX protein [Idiomarinaceae bacterium]MBF39939.1 SlyX protein [Idiomarinaceae bacterium]|tara:strand:+ start:12010 stop:12234 length:225 start_codon:yes stop_codon:yes gene_type:complete